MIKKLFYILILFVSMCNFALATTQDAQIEYDGCKYAFKPGDEAQFIKHANANMVLFQNAQTASDKVFYLQESMRYYFLLSQIDPKSIDAQIGLARIYDEMKLDKYAKKYFYVAFDFDPKKPRTNYYFGDFYYKRKDYITALFYFKRAYQYGFLKNYDLNYKQAVIYEKLADIQSAQKFYKNALSLNPQNSELENKIRLLDDLNYSQTQYYLYKK